MQVVDSGDSKKPCFSLAAHTSDVGDGEMCHGDIVMVHADPGGEDLHGKEVLVIPFDLRRHTRKETPFTIFEADDVASPLGAVSQKEEDESVESPKSSKCQYGVNSVTVPNPVLERFGASRSAVCLRSKERTLPSKKIAFAVVDGGQRRTQSIWLPTSHRS